MPPRVSDQPPTEDCQVTFTALAAAQVDQWEAACPCGFWTRGTRRQCEFRANGHPPRRVP